MVMCFSRLAAHWPGIARGTSRHRVTRLSAVSTAQIDNAILKFGICGSISCDLMSRQPFYCHLSILWISIGDPVGKIKLYCHKINSVAVCQFFDILSVSVQPSWRPNACLCACNLLSYWPLSIKRLRHGLLIGSESVTLNTADWYGLTVLFSNTTLTTIISNQTK
jgi:hypothetical protein